MKKFVAFLLSGIMVVSLSMTAFAAASPTATSVITATAESDDGDWDVVVSQDYSTEEEEEAVAEIITDYTSILQSVVESLTGGDSSVSTGSSSADITVDDVEDMELAYVMDVSLTGDVEYYDGSQVYITFSVPGITANSKVIILHYINGGWEKKDIYEIGTGYIVVMFDSFSPVAIYVDSETYESTSEGTSGSSTSDDSDSTSSPETGEFPVVFFSIIAALIACGGMAVAWKKRFN